MAGWFMAEGTVVISRALRAGLEPTAVLCDARRTDAVQPLVPESVAVYAAGPAVLDAVTGRPQLRDPIACFVRPPMPSPASLLADAHTVVVLEGVVNPTNMGVIVRCGAGLGVEAVLLDPTCCDPLYRRSVRVSMGEVFAVPHARLDSFPAGLADVREAGFHVAALTPGDDSQPLDSLVRTPGDRVAILLGTEGPGLSAAALETADSRLQIPMAAGVDSINVGSAAAVAFYALRAA